MVNLAFVRKTNSMHEPALYFKIFLAQHSHLQISLYYRNLLFLGKNILFHVSELGKKPPTFADSSTIAQEILDCGYEFDVGKIIYNKFR